ncbi:MAG: transposase [Candidatus Pacebacteria bacterium]|jgi:putative transposase|nr:transposase [Candidatus Paceibacterota bacterium]
MQRKIVISIGEYYHIYNRGTDKRTIFVEPYDFKRFNALLYVCNSTEPVDMREHFREGRAFAELFNIERGETLVEILAYCLMPNHFHLLLREKEEGGVTKFMGKLSTAYATYFNKKNKRTGALFESRFKAKHASTDEYLKYLFAYIHLNPVKIIEPKWKEKGIHGRVAAQDFLNEYAHSSYLDWQGSTRPESKILNIKAGPEYFTTAKEFDDFVNDWLTFKND